MDQFLLPGLLTPGTSAYGSTSNMRLAGRVGSPRPHDDCPTSGKLGAGVRLHTSTLSACDSVSR